MWEKLLNFFLKRTEARAAGLSAKEADKVAATQVVLEEVAKKAEQEAAKK